MVKPGYGMQGDVIVAVVNESEEVLISPEPFLAEAPHGSLSQLIISKAVGTSNLHQLFTRERRVTQLGKDDHSFHSEVGPPVVTPNERGQRFFTITGAYQRCSTSGFKQYSLVGLVVQHVLKHRGSVGSQLRTMSERPYGGVAIYCAVGFKRCNRVIVVVQKVRQFGQRPRSTADYLTMGLECLTGTDVRGLSLKQVRLTACSPRSICVHLRDDPITGYFKHRPVTRGYGRWPRAISFRTLGGGLWRTDGGGGNRTAKCAYAHEYGLVCRNGTMVLERAGDERDKVVVAQPHIPCPTLLGWCIAHPDSEISLCAYFHAQPGSNAKKVGKPQSLYLGRPDLVGATISLKLDWFETASPQSLHGAMYTCGSHAEETKKARVRFEWHQRSLSRSTRRRSGASTPKAFASRKMFSSETFRLPRSTELMYVLWRLEREASSSCESPAEVQRRRRLVASMSFGSSIAEPPALYCACSQRTKAVNYGSTDYPSQFCNRRCYVGGFTARAA